MNETPKTKRGWRILRRILIAIGILATLVAIFYTEEDWRGKRAWENCKRELEAKGETLDWNAYIPPPVPDDQNFFKASTNIALRFVMARDFTVSEVARRVTLQSYDGFLVFDTAKAKPLVVAQLAILPTDAKFEPSKANFAFKLNDPVAGDQIGKLIQKTAGQSANGSQGFKFSEMQLSNLVPAQIFVEADSAPSIRDLENLIPPETATNIGRLQIEATADERIFQVVLTDVQITAAADYLKWSDQFEPDFDEIREALKRPYARIDGDYSRPYGTPIPNFITMRSLAQTLAQRSQCYLLLGQPEKALRELTLINDSRHLLEGKPSTLVAAMINVAIAGLYVSTIADGFRLHAWQEPQQAALQEQLKEINLSPLVAESFQSGRASACYTLETATSGELEKIFWFGNSKTNLWAKISSPRYLLFAVAPRGWVYQNMTAIAVSDENILAYFDLTNDLILTHKPREVDGGQQMTISQFSPLTFLAALSVPNFTKALQTTANNQTLVNEAQIVCALERFHLAHGEYPETLDALAPQFMETIPHDIIGGQPLHYRRTDDGKFLLYSVGWNETDDGGQVVFTKGGSVDREKGDWVWQYPQK
jgi:hypothetical protein